MEKYIMSEKEYNALDSYLTASKMYDSGIYIVQADSTDYGYDDEIQEVMSLKDLIYQLFIDNCPEELIGYKGFTKKDKKIIKELYDKLEDVDIKDLPNLEKTKEILNI